MNDINLLPNQSENILKQGKAEAMMQRIAIVVLSATAFISIVLFILVVQSPLSKEKQREQTLLSSLSLSATRISRNVIIQERLSSIEKILKERNSYDKNLDLIIRMVPSNLSLSSIQIKKTTIEISGSSTSYEAVSRFLDSVTDLKNREKKIKTIVLKTYSQQTENAGYYFTIEVTFI